MKKRIEVVRQEGVKDCGVASLLSIIRYYKGNISIEKLREMTYTTKTGTTAFHIIECAQKLGFMSKGIKCNSIYNIKNNINIPFIAHVIINKSYKHYIVVYNIDYKKENLTIMDPAYGIKKISFNEFNQIWSKIIISFIPIKKLPIYKNNKEVLSLIKHIIISNKKLFLSIFLLSFFVTIFEIINSYYFKIIVDEIIISSINNLYYISLFFMFLIIIKCMCDYFRNKLLIYINNKIEFLLITKTFNHIINLPYDYFKNKTTGEIISRISDLNYIKELISKLIITIFIDTILFIFSFIILFSINKTLFLITIIILILYCINIIMFSSTNKSRIRKIQEKYSLVNSHLIESINGYETIKSLSLQNIFQNKLENKYSDYLNENYRINNHYNLQQLFKNLINEIGILIILFVGYLNVLDGKLSFGELITYNSLLIYFLGPIKNILELEPLIKYANSSYKRVNELLDIKREILTIDNKYTGTKIKGDIVFKNFDYILNDKTTILKDINLNIKQGEKVIIVGMSGCGKSTLLKSILRYSKVERNKIFINNKDINDYNLKELRNNIVYVSQNEMLFTDSIINNIRIKKNIDFDNFLKLANLLEIDKICNKRYLGYDTLLEENGFNISGGERNRIILSRALTIDSNICLFDEALNELDVNMERRILKKFFEISKNKTVIVVSHRLLNIDLFDKIINLENGTIKNIKERILNDNG